MDGYEQDQWEQLQRRREKTLSRRTRSLVPTTLKESAATAGRLAVDRAKQLPRADDAADLLATAADGAGEVLSRFARDSIRTGQVLKAYEKATGEPLSAITDVRRLPLRTLDDVRPRLDTPYILAGALSGAGAGVLITGGEALGLAGGAVTAPAGGAGLSPGMATVVGAMAADATVTILASMRLVFHVATYYGFDVTRPEERLRAMSVLNVATLTEQGAKHRAYRDLHRLVKLLASNATWQQLNDNVITAVFRQVYTHLGERLTKKKLGGALPVAGIAIGAAFNARTLSRIADTADLLYREAFLQERLGIAPAIAPSEDDDDVIEAEAVDLDFVKIVDDALDSAATTPAEDGATGEFVLQFDPAEIEPLASRFGYADDSSALAAGTSARGRGFYTTDELALVCRWKSPRGSGLVIQNLSDEVQAATRIALAADTPEADRADALTGLRGVGMPSASALMHFAFPDRYPILDVRALESLGVAGRSTYTTAFWLRYVDACRALAARHGVSLRTLDKALWQHSKEG
jgi:hypothetical protein